jgi:prepilin-type N-terminal cleavage/methylation domain-containing protein
MQVKRGFTVVEVLASVGIFSMIITVVVVMQIAILRSNQVARTRSSIDQQSLIILRNFTSELQGAQTPNDGSFPLASTTDSTLSFYFDKSDDGIVERIRYSVEAGMLKRGIIIPSGQPLTYNPANESVVTILDNVLAQPPYFIYYGSDFDGASSTPPLTQPVSASNVRLVELHLAINTKIAALEARTLQTRVTVRSLKNK